MKTWLGLAFGALAGTMLRYETGYWIAPLHNGFPLGTLCINLAGCLFLGWFFTVVPLRWKLPSYIRISISTGFTGAFTTFSSFSLETVNLIGQQRIDLAFGYVALSVGGGIALAALGYALGQAQLQMKRGRP